MAKIYKVNSPSEALALARRFKKEKKYDLFRGQNENWPLISSQGRLSPEKIEENGERLLWLFDFLSQYKSTNRYTKNIDDFIAIAQHYGIPTDFIDLTRSPEVALFFATHSKQSLIDKEGVLICLNSDDFKTTIEFCSIIFEREDITPPYIYEAEIDNLWRLKAQNGCFLQSELINLETIYPFDKIIFPHNEYVDIIDISTIYPENKSDLEILLDNFFAAERINEGALRLQHFAEEFSIPITKLPSRSHYKYVKSRKWHSSWKTINTKKWTYKVSEPLSKRADINFELNVSSTRNFQKDILKIKNQLLHIFKEHQITRRDFISPSIKFTPKIRSKKLLILINKSVKYIWDGMRTLPYSRPQIIYTIAKYLVLELYHSAKQVDIETCFYLPILISMSNHFGAHCRCYVSENALEEAIREDILQIQADSLPQTVSTQLLFYVQKIKIVFDFNKLTRLFASEIIPSMMVRNKHTDRAMSLFSPVYVDRLGYA